MKRKIYNRIYYFAETFQCTIQFKSFIIVVYFKFLIKKVSNVRHKNSKPNRFSVNFKYYRITRITRIYCVISRNFCWFLNFVWFHEIFVNFEILCDFTKFLSTFTHLIFVPSDLVSRMRRGWRDIRRIGKLWICQGVRMGVWNRLFGAVITHSITAKASLV